MAASRFSVDNISPSSPTSYRGEYPFPRQGSRASSIHSVGGSLDTSKNWHGVSEASQNAISTLLQPPIVRTGLIPYTTASASSTHKPPTARDIPPVTLTNIPTIDPSVFKPYLSQVGALYDALQRAKENEEEGATQLQRKGVKVDDLQDIVSLERRQSLTRSPTIVRHSSVTSILSPNESLSSRREITRDSSRRAIHAPTPLTTIPNVYFDENFHLENPRTFDVVSERSEVVRQAPGTPDERRGFNGAPAGPRKALATNAILQEKLSWYMDTIEVHLISSISTASTSFFAALGSLRHLHSEAADSVNRIKLLRKELEGLDKEMAIGGLDIVSKRRKRENLKQLSDAVQQLRRIVENVAACEDLVDKGNVEKSLDAIDTLEKLIAGEECGEVQSDEKIQLWDLRGAIALRGVTSDLDILRLRIGKTYETRFLSALLGDLRRHIDSVSSTDALQRWSKASSRTRGGHNREPSVHPTYLSMSDDFRSDLLSSLRGLNRARHTSPSTTAYRDLVLREVRNVIRRPLPASNEDDADSMMSASTLGGGAAKHKTQQEKSSILARNLRAMDAEDAEELLKKIYIGVGETLRRLGTQVKVLLDVTSSLSDSAGSSGIKSPLRSPNSTSLDARVNPSSFSSGRDIQEEMHQILDMSNLLGQAVDIAQEKIVKILKVRAEQSISLSVEQFLRYFTLNLLFANECEAVSGRSGTALKNVVNGQIKEFVRQLGETERQALASGMEADPWNAKDFTEADNEVLTRMLAASTRDSDAWTVGSKIWIPASAPRFPAITSLLAANAQSNGTSGASTPSTAPASKATTRPAIIESESFLLPVSAILCLNGLSSFLHLNTCIPSMTSEIGSSIVSYLTLFNSRCTQLILGAGATRSAGLKNITTKHLALAAQALSFISTLIPHIREFIRRQAGTGISVSLTMSEFDKVRRAYLEHQQSIYDKLVDIMSGRAAAHAKAMKLIDWESERDGVNTYMETLTKETNTLHRVLSKHLPELTVQMIMQPVFGAYKEQWGRAFGDVVLGSEGARDRMLRDVEHFKTRIGGLGGAGDTADHLYKLVREKPVPRPRAVPASAPEAGAPENTGAVTNGTTDDSGIRSDPT